jgi:predicted nucleic acid-binding protein
VILVDAGPMVALLSDDDQHRARCVDAVRRIRVPMATVWPAVTEAVYLLKSRPRAQEALLEQIETENLGLVPLDRSDLPRIRELMRKYRDLPMALADAALVRVAERDGIDTVFTVDSRDFQVYRLLGRRRFKIIP